MSYVRTAVVCCSPCLPLARHPLMHTSCSVLCFREHKRTHLDAEGTPVPAASPQPVVQIELPATAPPPVPAYLRTRTDFSRLATDVQFQTLLRTHPTLLPALQRIYAATIEPDPEDAPRGTRGRGAFRGARGRRGANGRGGGRHHTPKWTPQQGDRDALRMLKKLRQESNAEDAGSLGDFVRLVDERYGEAKRTENDGYAIDTL